jgi:hypothetical protein
MKLPVSDESIDAAKKTIGGLLLFAAAAGELLLVDQTTTLARLATIAGWIGGGILGLGFMNARGKAATALLQMVFGTAKPSEVQQEAIAVAQQVASLAPPPMAGDYPQGRMSQPLSGSAADNAITWPKQAPPPPPRSKP